MACGLDIGDVNMDEFWGQIRSMRQHYAEIQWAAHVDELLADRSSDPERWIAVAKHIIGAYLATKTPVGESMIVGIELKGGRRCNYERLTHWKTIDILQRISSVPIWYAITYDRYPDDTVKHPVAIEGFSDDSRNTHECLYAKWRSPHCGTYMRQLRVYVRRGQGGRGPV